MNELDSEKRNYEKNVRDTVTKFSQAFLEADIETLESMLTDNYIHINGRSGSILNRTEWISWMKSRRIELENKELQINDYRVEDVIVKVYQNVAIVSGVVKSSGIRKKEAFTSLVRFTNTWIFSENKWKRAAFHDSPLPNQIK